MKLFLTILLSIFGITANAQFQTINLGANPNDKTGDKLRSAFEKVNGNFTLAISNYQSDVFLTNSFLVAPIAGKIFHFDGRVLSEAGLPIFTATKIVNQSGLFGNGTWTITAITGQTDPVLKLDAGGYSLFRRNLITFEGTNNNTVGIIDQDGNAFFNGILTANGTGLTNLETLAALGIDADALAYCRLTSISNATEVTRISRCFQELKRAGLWGNLVDGVLMRTNQGGSSLKTIYGGTVTNTGSGTFDGNGWTSSNTEGASALGLPIRISGLITNTVIVGMKQNVNSDFGFPWSMQNTAGLTTSGVAARFGDGAGSFLGAYVRQGGGAEVLTPTTFTTLTNAGIFSNDPRFNNIGIGYNRSVAVGYWNGSVVEVAAGVTVTTAMNVLMLGGVSLSGGASEWSWAGTYSHVLVFDKLLSRAEAAKVESALRWLDSQEDTLLVIGDSMSMFHNNFPGRDWPVISTSFPEVSNRFRIYNPAASGATTVDYLTGITNWTMLSSQRGQNLAYIWLGVNDINSLGSSTATIWGNLSNICQNLAVYGWTPMISTLPPITNGVIGWDATKEGKRNELNAILATNKLFSVIRRDLLFTEFDMMTNNANGFSIDGLHMGTNGNQRIAQATFLKQNLDVGFSGKTNSTAPADGTTIKGWVNFTDGNGQVFKIPFYK